jgi:hypothetical protein
MRTTIIIDNDLIARAAELTGTKEKTTLVRMGLEYLIARESAKKLAKFGGTGICPPISTAQGVRVSWAIRSFAWMETPYGHAASQGPAQPPHSPAPRRPSAA